MKKRIVVIMLVLSALVFSRLAFAQPGCCLKSECKCKKVSCCEDGKCACKGNCCAQDACKCLENKCSSECQC